jgi:hypothetical protein
MDLLNMLAAGGDVGIWAVVFGLYKLDKRILMLEFWIDQLRRGQNVDTKKAS